MRFDNHEPVGPIINKRDQTRFVLMICGIGLLLFVINVASQSNFWSTLMPDQQQKADPKDDTPFVIGGREPGRRPLAPGEMFIGGGQASAEDRIYAIEKSHREAPTEAIRNVRRSENTAFDEDLLKTVLDNRLGVRASESKAYYAMLKRAKHEKIADDAIELDTSYSVLMANPDYYRGAPIQITGKLKRLVPFEADEERQFNLATLYDAWIFTRDSGNMPYHVVCSSVGSLRLNETFENPPEVKVTGYFFKRESYSTQSGEMQTTPLILANGIYPVPIIETVAKEGGQIQRYLSWFAIIVGGALFFTLWNFTVSDMNYRFSRASQSLAPPATADLQGVDSVDIHEVLRDLSESPEFSGNNFGQRR